MGHKHFLVKIVSCVSVLHLLWIFARRRLFVSSSGNLNISASSSEMYVLLTPDYPLQETPAISPSFQALHWTCGWTCDHCTDWLREKTWRICYTTGRSLLGEKKVSNTGTLDVRCIKPLQSVCKHNSTPFIITVLNYQCFTPFSFTILCWNNISGA